MAPPAAPGPGGRALPELEPIQAWWRGTITALVVVLPAGVLNQYLVDSGDIDSASPATFLFWVLILFGGAAGGWAVIRLSPQARVSYAAAAGGAAYVVVQLIGVVRRLISGDPISWLAFPLLALLMATCGMLGGMLAKRWMRQNGSSPG
jgi:TRAP-type C4-dicarboxylate transport system permease small subunit